MRGELVAECGRQCVGIAGESGRLTGASAGGLPGFLLLLPEAEGREYTYGL